MTQNEKQELIRHSISFARTFFSSLAVEGAAAFALLQIGDFSVSTWKALMVASLGALIKAFLEVNKNNPNK